MLRMPLLINTFPMTRVIFFVILTLLVTCCGSERRKSTNDASLVVPVTLKGSIVPVDGLPGSGFIGIRKEGIITKHFNLKQFGIQPFRYAEGKLVAQEPCARMGRGPFEFDLVSSNIQDDTLYLVNMQNIGGSVTDIYSIPLSPYDSIGNIKRWKRTELDWTEMRFYFGSFVWLDNGRLLMLSGEQDEDNFLTIVDTVSKKKIPLGYTLRDGMKVDALTKKFVYMQNVNLLRNGDKVVFTLGVGHYAEILTLDGNKITDRNLIYSELPECEVRGDQFGFAHKEGTPMGIDACSTSQYIYFQKKYYRKEGENGYPWYCEDEVEVYDWDGKFIRKYRTDVPFYTMIVSDDDREMYVMTVDRDTKDNIMMKYELL